MAGTDLALPALTVGRVLIADDGDDQALTLAVLFQLQGFEARTARTGREVLALVHAYRPHVLVLDLGLPDADGCGVIRQVRSTPRPPAVVVVTGYTDAARRRAALEAGAAAYLLKPADPQKLIRLVRVLRGTAAAPGE